MKTEAEIKELLRRIRSLQETQDSQRNIPEDEDFIFERAGAEWILSWILEEDTQTFEEVVEGLMNGPV